MQPGPRRPFLSGQGFAAFARCGQVRSPFGRVSVPEDVAAAVVWLVSSANPYANGQKININGGG